MHKLCSCRENIHAGEKWWSETQGNGMRSKDDNSNSTCQYNTSPLLMKQWKQNNSKSAVCNKEMEVKDLGSDGLRHRN